MKGRIKKSMQLLRKGCDRVFRIEKRIISSPSLLPSLLSSYLMYCGSSS